jgi:apolipoprotein N-acyltransferase
MRTQKPPRPREQPAPAIIARPEPRLSPLPYPCLLPALATGVLLWLAYFPVDWGWLGWITLVPLLCLVRSEARPRRIYWCAWACGLAFFWPALQWMRVADYRMYATWALLATYCSFYIPAAVFLVRRLDRGTGLPLVVTLPVVWTGLELLRTHLLSGFAWYYLGHTQHAFLPFIQVADVTGAYGVTFLVAGVNAVAFEWLYRRRGFRAWLSLPTEAPRSSPWALPAQTAVMALLLGGVLAYGAWRLGQEGFVPGPRVALLQSSIDQRIRNFAAVSEEARTNVGQTYVKLCDLARKQQPRPDLVVWPETSFPAEWIEVSPQLPDTAKVGGEPVRIWRGAAEVVRRRAGNFAAFCNSNMLFGLNTEVATAEGTVRRYNSALLFRKDKGWLAPEFAVGERYDKMHRVPFGEFVPLRDWLPFMDAIAPYDYDYSICAGERQTRLPLASASGRRYYFGVLICYEDTDPNLARQFARSDGDAPPADFLVNISNDGWFDGTSEHEEHLAICRFRAVESRRAVARSVNMGVSAVIDGSGRVLAPETRSVRDGFRDWRVGADAGELAGPDWHGFKKVQGVLTATIPIDDRTSLYAYLGDWLPGGCWLVVAAGLFWRRFQPRQV